jgi:hypothetical protein
LQKWGNLKAKKNVAEHAVQNKGQQRAKRATTAQLAHCGIFAGGHFDSADWAMQAKKAQGITEVEKHNSSNWLLLFAGAGANQKKPLPPHLRKP